MKSRSLAAAPLARAAPDLEHALYPQGIRVNLHQFVWQAVQVCFVGLLLGTERTVLPVLAARDFGVPAGSFVALLSFVIAFGLVKGALNFVAGRLSERIGRKTVLELGWLAAIPIPVSCTERMIFSFSSSRRTFTLPFSSVYLIAFSTRLITS